MTAALPLGSVILLASSPPAPPDFQDQLDHVELAADQDDIQLIAYDHHAQVLGSIALWTDPDGTAWIVSDYGDGFAQVTIAPDGEVSTEASLPSDVIASRAEAMIDSVREPNHPQEGRLSCALSLAGTAVSCAAASWFCPITTISTACNCLPLVVKEWRSKKCPGFG